jgi:flagellar motor switch protein FliG
MSASEVAAVQGCARAAALLEAVGAAKAVEVLRYLSPEEMARLAPAFAQLGKLAPQERRTLCAQALDDLQARLLLPAEDPLAFARQILGAHLGPEAADQLLLDSSPSLATPLSLEWVTEAAAETLAEGLKEENAQIIAVALSALRPVVAARVLALLPEEVRGESALQLAQGVPPMPEALTCIVEQVAQDLKLVEAARQTGRPARTAQVNFGPGRLVDILRQCDRPTESSALEYLEARAPELAQRVSQSIFSTIADLRWLSGRSLQLLLRQVEIRDLARALRGGSATLVELCTGNLSANAAAALKEELESLGPTPKREVEAAQKVVLDKVRTLVEEGQIQIEQADELV